MLVEDLDQLQRESELYHGQATSTMAVLQGSSRAFGMFRRVSCCRATLAKLRCVDVDVRGSVGGKAVMMAAERR